MQILPNTSVVTFSPLPILLIVKVLIPAEAARSFFSYPRVFTWYQNRGRSIELRQNLTRPVSPCVARKKKSGKYPTSHNKAHTADLSRFVGRKKQRIDWHNANLCAVLSNISISPTLHKTAGPKPKPDEHTNH